MPDPIPIPDKDKGIADTMKDANQVLEGVIESGKSTSKTFKNKNFGKKLKKFLQAIAGVGYIVEGFTKFAPNPDDPLIEHIDELGKNVEALGNKVSQNLGEMKALITEINFFVRILSPAFKLMRYKRDCFHFPGKDANENFLKAYKKTPSLKLAYYLQSYLEQESTNPLKHAMDLEKIKLKTTFEKWEDIFARVMLQFMIIEVFAKSLMKNKNEATLDKLIEVFIKIFTQLGKWEKEYVEITGPNFWKEMKPWTENYLKNSSKLTNAVKADEIRKKMETYFLSYPYYIIVLNSAKENQEYGFLMQRYQPLETFLNMGGCNVIIYQSWYGWKDEKNEETEKLEDDDEDEPEALSLIKDHVDYFRSGKLTYNRNLDDIFEKQILPSNNESGSYFHALVWKDKKPEVRWANSHEFEKGPGWWTTVKIKDASKPVTYDYILLASFGYKKGLF